MKLNVAICMATELHDAQLDKGGKPYIFHSLRVMLAVEHHGESAMVVAVLHDVEEDTRGLPPEYWHTLTNREAAALIAITRGWEGHEQETYAEYIERVAANQLASIVKVADLRDNLSPVRQAALPEGERKSLERRYTRTLDRLVPLA